MKAFAKDDSRAPSPTSAVQPSRVVSNTWGTRNLVLGVSGWRGKSNFSLPRLTTTVGVAEFDARYRHRRLELRGEFARVGISDAADLNDAIARLTGVSPNVAEGLQGFMVKLRTCMGCWLTAGLGRVCPLRELRHAASNAGWIHPAEGVRSGRLGLRPDVLSRPRHRGKGRLRAAAQSEQRREVAELVQCRPWLVVLTVHGAHMGIGRIAAVMGAVIFAGEFLMARQDSPRVIYITAERFSFSPSQISLRLGEEVEFRISSEDTSPWLPHRRHIAQYRHSEERSWRTCREVSAGSSRTVAVRMQSDVRCRPQLHAGSGDRRRSGGAEDVEMMARIRSMAAIIGGLALAFTFAGPMTWGQERPLNPGDPLPEFLPPIFQSFDWDWRTSPKSRRRKKVWGQPTTARAAPSVTACPPSEEVG